MACLFCTVRLLPDCDERLCLDHQAQMDICMGQGEAAEKFHDIMGQCAMERMSIFGEMAKDQIAGMKDMENDPNAPCELKDFLMHALGMKRCMLVKMGWMCEETCQLIPENISECFGKSPVADSFFCEMTGERQEPCDVVKGCMEFGELMTCENMEEFVTKLEEMDMEYFKDLAMEGMNMDDMPEGDMRKSARVTQSLKPISKCPSTAAVGRMADMMEMDEESFLNFSRNLVKLNCLKVTPNLQLTSSMPALTFVLSSTLMARPVRPWSLELSMRSLVWRCPAWVT